MLHWYMKQKRNSNVTCDYSCSLKGTMKTHVASVHEEKKPFKCDICDYSCSRKGNMNRHVSTVHEKISYSNVAFVITHVLNWGT